MRTLVDLTVIPGRRVASSPEPISAGGAGQGADLADIPERPADMGSGLSLREPRNDTEVQS